LDPVKTEWKSVFDFQNTFVSSFFLSFPYFKKDATTEKHMDIFYWVLFVALTKKFLGIPYFLFHYYLSGLFLYQRKIAHENKKKNT